MAILGGFIVPHPPIAVAEIGQGRESEIQDTIDSFNRIADEIKSLQPDTVIITSPHSIMYRDYFHISPGLSASGDFSAFGAGEVKFNADYDTALSSYIDEMCDKAGFPAGTMGERDPKLDHGTMVPLYFITKKYSNFSLLRIGLSGLPLETHYTFGKMIANAIDALDRRVVFVASGDLAHCQKEDGPYGYRPEGPKYDELLMQTLSSGKLEKLIHFDEKLLEDSMECGHRSFTIMAGALSGYNYHTTPLSHQATFGVGYGFAICNIKGRKEMEKTVRSDKDAYVRLARNTIEAYIRKGLVFSPEEHVDEMLKNRAGAFVSIHKFGSLRGCIGTFLPATDCIENEIIQNAISASTRDPRFKPITEDELEHLDISVDILSAPEAIDDISVLDAKKYGVIVEYGQQRGLLLPNLDGVDSPLQQIDICKQKAGIQDDIPTEELSLQRFEVVRHE